MNYVLPESCIGVDEPGWGAVKPDAAPDDDPVRPGRDYSALSANVFRAA